LATNEPNPDPQFEGSEAVRELARSRLTSLPDFPERILGRINELQEDYHAGRIAPDSYDTKRAHLLGRIALFPDPRVVKVLGQLLEDWEWPGWKGDPKNRPPYDPGDVDVSVIPPNCVYAARSFARLIENPPVQQKDVESYSFNEVEIYQLWYAQVKS